MLKHIKSSSANNGLLKSVTHAAFRQDIFGVGGVLFQLLAQVVNIKADVMRLVAVFIAPHFGEQLLELEVFETKAVPRLGGGAVTIKLSVKNQKDEVAQQGTWIALMMGKPQ